MPPAKDNNCYLNFLATHDGIGLKTFRRYFKNNDLKILLKTLKNLVQNLLIEKIKIINELFMKQI